MQERDSRWLYKLLTLQVHTKRGCRCLYNLFFSSLLFSSLSLYVWVYRNGKESEKWCMNVYLRFSLSLSLSPSLFLILSQIFAGLASLLPSSSLSLFVRQTTERLMQNFFLSVRPGEGVLCNSLHLYLLPCFPHSYTQQIKKNQTPKNRISQKKNSSYQLWILQ